jgi:hypothetical protein
MPATTSSSWSSVLRGVVYTPSAVVGALSDGSTFKAIGALVAEIFPIQSMPATTSSSWSSVLSGVVYTPSAVF